MKNPQVTVAGINLARAAKLAQQAMDAVSTGDHAVVARLVAESRDAVDAATKATNHLLRAISANDEDS